MNKSSWAVACVTLFALLYHISPYTGMPDFIIMGMFIISPLLVCYMVYAILKYGIPSGKTFDEQYYDDQDQ